MDSNIGSPALSPVVHHSSRKNTRLLIVGFGMFALVGCASFVAGTRWNTRVQVGPTPTVTQPDTTPVANRGGNWNDYHNTQAGFRIKYPDNPRWNAYIENSESDETAAFMCESDCSKYTLDLFQITPVIFTSIDEYMAKDSLVKNKQAIPFNGIDAIQGVQPGNEQSGGSSIVLFFVHEGNGYLITERYWQVYDTTAIDMFPAPVPDFLSTFRFDSEIDE